MVVEGSLGPQAHHITIHTGENLIKKYGDGVPSYAAKFSSTVQELCMKYQQKAPDISVVPTFILRVITQTLKQYRFQSDNPDKFRIREERITLCAGNTNYCKTLNIMKVVLRSDQHKTFQSPEPQPPR